MVCYRAIKAPVSTTLKSAGMIMVVRVHCPWYVPECYTLQCKERSIPQGGEYDHGGGVCVDIGHGRT